jgi:hypothetical protein
MSNGLTRTGAVAVAMTLAFALCAATSSASGWHSNAGIRYSGGGTGGSSTAPVGATKFSLGATTVNCTGGTAIFGLTAATGPLSGTWTSAMTTTITLSGCRTGGTTLSVVCVLGLDAVSYNGGTPTSYLGSAGKVTAGIVQVDCTFSTGTACAHLRGTASGSYRNPSVLNGDLPNPISTSTDGRYTLTAAGQRLTMTVTGGCGLPSGTGTLTSSTGGDLIITLTGASPQPVIWRES